MEQVSLQEAAQKIGRAYHQVHRAVVKYHRVPYSRNGYKFSLAEKDLSTLKEAIDEISRKNPCLKRHEAEEERIAHAHAHAHVEEEVATDATQERFERIENVLRGILRVLGQMSDHVLYLREELAGPVSEIRVTEQKESVQ